MVRHECGFEQEIFCRRCGFPVFYNRKIGLHCPRCGREITLLCPGCGKRW